MPEPNQAHTARIICLPNFLAHSRQWVPFVVLFQALAWLDSSPLRLWSLTEEGNYPFYFIISPVPKIAQYE